MTIEELEDLAFRKAPMPELESQADTLAYLSFRNLYDFASRVHMVPEQGKREKAQIVSTHRKNRFEESVLKSSAELWKRIEDAASEYRKSPSVERADKLLEAIYGVKRKCFQEEWL